MKNGFYEGVQFIDDKQVRKYLFMRKLFIIAPGQDTHQTVEVHAFNKDHAVERLLSTYPGSRKREWDFLDELQPEHFIGVMGETLRLEPPRKATLQEMIRKALT